MKSKDAIDAIMEDALLEAPQLTDPLKSALGDKTENPALAKQLLRRTKYSSTVYSEEGVTVKRYKNNLFALEYVGSVLNVSYYARLSKVMTPLGGGIYQNLVWKRYGAAHPSCRKLMLDYLLPEYGLLVCDRQQTDDGRRLWLDVAGSALDKGKLVYGWNQATGQTVPIHSTFDIEVEKTWGREVSFQDKRIIVVN